MESSTQRLTAALRWTGAIMVASSGAIFLLQGLTAMSSYGRFLAFAGVTAALSAIGLIVGAKYKETKSARTFLGLAAAATPVLFSQLGAMMHALTNAMTSPNMPKMLLLSAPSFAQLAVATAVTMLVMAPILYIGFGAFFREHAKELVIMLFGASALLLIPSRAPEITALMLFGQAGVMTWFAATSRRRSSGSRESMMAGLLALVPALIMIGRQCFYGGSNLLIAAVCALAAGVMVEFIPFLAPNHPGIRNIRLMGLGSAILSWQFLTTAALGALNWPEGCGILVGAYPALAATLMLLPRHPSYNWVHRAGRPLSLFLVGISALQGLDISVAVLFLGVGATAGVAGYARRNQSVTESGALAMFIGVAYFVFEGFTYLSAIPWITLAVAGALVISAAAWLEKNRAQLGRWQESYNAFFNEPLTAGKLE